MDRRTFLSSLALGCSAAASPLLTTSRLSQGAEARVTGVRSGLAAA